MRYQWHAHADAADTGDTVLLSVSKKQRHVFMVIVEMTGNDLE